MTNQPQTKFDIAIVGSGPAGCTAGILLARKGYRVVLIEREAFPRFHIGESLLAASQEIWERLGIAEDLQHSGYTFKYGGGFRLGVRPDQEEFTSATVHFRRVPKKDLGPRPFAYHVDRHKFDKQLQDSAVSQGVTLWERTSVEEVLFEDRGGRDRAVGLRIRKKGMAAEVVHCDFVIDASGRRCLVGRQLGCVESDPLIRTSAVFAQFRGVSRDPGALQGYFNGYFIENGWIWFIPLADDVMSVGLVQNEPSTNLWSSDPEQVLLDAINRYRFVQSRFKDAVQVSRVRSMTKLAYRTTQFCGDGWLSIGDANFFVDPLYSSGVHLAHSTGEMAADVVDRFLSQDRDMREIKSFERHIERYRRNVFGVIYAVYDLLRNRSAIRLFNWMAGQLGRDFDTWMLRRVAAWSAGFFDRHMGVMRLTEIFGRIAARVVPAITRLWGDHGWARYEQHRYTGPRLTIPKEITPEIDRQLANPDVSEARASAPALVSPNLDAGGSFASTIE